MANEELSLAFSRQQSLAHAATNKEEQGQYPPQVEIDRRKQYIPKHCSRAYCVTLLWHSGRQELCTLKAFQNRVNSTRDGRATLSPKLNSDSSLSCIQSIHQYHSITVLRLISKSKQMLLQRYFPLYRSLLAHPRVYFSTGGPKAYSWSEKDDVSHSFKAIPNYYQVLQLPISFTEIQLKERYLQKVKQFHPDLAGDQTTNRSAFDAVQSAYEVLGDRSKKTQYDKLLIAQIQKQALSQYEEGNPHLKSMQDILKGVSPKDLVPQAYHFSYTLLKDHYDNIRVKNAEYIKYHGEDKEYYAHPRDSKDQKINAVWKRLGFGILLGFSCIFAGWKAVWRNPEESQINK